MCVLTSRDKDRTRDRRTTIVKPHHQNSTQQYDCTHSFDCDMRAGQQATQLQHGVGRLHSAMSAIHGLSSIEEQARACRVLRLETMTEIRVDCDAVEALVPAEMWTLATYKELLFLDTHARSTV